jgi:predicted nucleotidyltransferase
MNLLDVINTIAPALANDENINALWIEGSWATGKNNDMSDIDVWIDVEDNSFEACIAQFRAALSDVGTIDWEKSRGVYSEKPKLQKHTFHLQGFPEAQRIELDLQQHSRKFIFKRDEHTMQPIFDKADVIRWE